MSTEHVQSMCVKIALLRDWTDSPFLKFTLVAASGELWEFIWHAGASGVLGFQLVNSSGLIHTQTHLLLSHTKLAVQQGEEEETGWKRWISSRGLTFSKVSVQGTFWSDGQTFVYLFFWLLVCGNGVPQDSEDKWGLVGEGRVKFPLYTWRLA